MNQLMYGGVLLLLVGLLALDGGVESHAQPEPLLSLVAKVDLPVVSIPFGGGSSLTFKAMDVWAEGDVVAVSAHEWVHLIDLSDPQNPVIANTIPMTAGDGAWDVKIQNQILYVALQMSQRANTLLIYDIADPYNPVLLSNYRSQAFAGAHNFFVKDNVGFVASFGAFGNSGALTGQSINGAVWMVDLTDPQNPVDIGPIFTEDGGRISHVHDITVVGNRLYVAAWDTGIWLVDFENLDNTAELSYEIVGHEQYRAFLKPASATPSAHNIWPSQDGNLAWVTDEVVGEGVRVFDISDPSDIDLVGFFRLGNDTLPHNVIVDGQFAYVAHYSGGLQVLEYRALEGPVEVAHFIGASGPSGNAAFSGSFGVYPIGSHVLLSDMFGGLYVLEKGGRLAE